jgi:WD40 repeat protein
MSDEAKAVKTIFLTALEKAAGADRNAYLDEACAGDPALRQRVEALLRLHGQSDRLFDQPAAEHLAAGAAAAEALDFLEPSARAGSLGRLGHYEVLEVVGRGGMGLVLRAFDEKLHRLVALKVLDPALASNGSARQRFVREARAAAAVSHDHVIAIHAVEDEGPVPYLVMQLIHGKTLQEKLDIAGPLPVPAILRIGLQIAEGLAAAHRQGLIHRDIKPANILLENSVERVKITDFGLARAVDDASLTRSGSVAGTPHFMSPEQASGERVDARSDLFSLGSVLYTLCAGHPPFRAETTLAVLKRVCEETPRSLRDVNPAIPAWLEAVVARLHSKDRACRFAKAEDVAEVLSRRLTELQTGATPPTEVVSNAPPRRAPGRSRWKIALLAALGALGIGVLWWWLATRGARSPEGPGPPPAAGQAWQPRPPPTAEELARLPDPLDGWPRGEIPRSLRARILGPKAAPAELIGVLGGDGAFELPFTDETHWPAETPDGRLLALPCGDTVALYEPRTGALVRQLKGHTGRAFRGNFSPDGRRFVCGSNNGRIRIWDVASGKEEAALADAENHVWTTLFGPDEGQIVSASSPGGVHVWDVTSRRVVKSLVKRGALVHHLAFNPDRTRLAGAGQDGLVTIWDCKSWEPVKTLKGQEEPVHRVAWSADGAWLASGGQARVILWDTATLQPRHTLAAPARGVLAFTPKGQTLVTAPHELSPTTKRAFSRWDVKTGEALNTREVAGMHNFLVGDLSVDGRTVYLMSCSPPEPRLSAVDAATGEARFPQQGHSQLIWNMAFSPDGGLLASGGIDGRVCLWDLTRRPSGELVTPPRTLPGQGGVIGSVAFSPDGRLLASGLNAAGVQPGRRDAGGVRGPHGQPLGGEDRATQGAARLAREGRPGRGL